MEAECRNSLQAGSKVDFASQNCWEGLDTLKSLLPAICFHWCSSAFCCSLHPCLLLFLHIRFSDILLENPILVKVCGMNSHPIQPSRDKKRRAVQVKTKRKINQRNFCQSSETSDCSGQRFKYLIRYTKRPQNNYFCWGREDEVLRWPLSPMTSTLLVSRSRADALTPTCSPPAGLQRNNSRPVPSYFSSSLTSTCRDCFPAALG